MFFLVALVTIVAQPTVSECASWGHYELMLDSSANNLNIDDIPDRNNVLHSEVFFSELECVGACNRLSQCTHSIYITETGVCFLIDDFVAQIPSDSGLLSKKKVHSCTTLRTVFKRIAKS